jgi:hypothetical protein
MASARERADSVVEARACTAPTVVTTGIYTPASFAREGGRQPPPALDDPRTFLNVSNVNSPDLLDWLGYRISPELAGESRRPRPRSPPPAAAPG